VLQFSQLLHVGAVVAVALALVEAILASTVVNLPGAGRWGYGVASTGTAPTGMAEIGTTVTGTGTVTLIMFTITSCSLVALAFPGGGAGAGAAGAARGAGAGAVIHTDTTVTAIPTATDTPMATAMVTVAPLTGPMATAMDTGPSTNTDNTEIAASPEFRNYSSGCNALGITTDLLTESWGHRREAQSGRTKKTTET